MNYLKPKDIVEEYKVGLRTVFNWVERAKVGDLKLDLVTKGKRTYIVNSEQNHVVISQLSTIGKKFKNSKSLKELSPKKEFFQIFNEDQIIDIIKNLEVHKEIPLKYSYMNGGASSWDKHAHRMWQDNSATKPNTVELVNFNLDYIHSLILKYNKINVVDIGPGNAFPVKKLLTSLLEKKKLAKYMALDYSPDMLGIAEKNLKDWFGDDFPFEGHVADVTSETFQSLLYKNSSFTGENVACANVILYLGGTIENDRFYDQQLRLINYSMGKSDIFVLEQGLDVDSVKLRLTFGTENPSEENSDLEHRKMVLDLLNITPDLYTVERLYSPKEKAKLIRVHLNVDLKINITTQNLNQTIYLPNKEHITIWRYNSHTAMEVINEMSKSGYEILNFSTSMDKESVMVISSLRTLNN